MKSTLIKIGIITLCLIILLSTTVMGASGDVSGLLEQENTQDMEPIMSVGSQITRILGTLSTIIMVIMLIFIVI